MGLGLGLGLGVGLGLRHDALKTSVGNNFVHIRRIGIRRNGAEPLVGLELGVGVKTRLVTDSENETALTAP